MESCVLYNLLWKNAVLALIGAAFVWAALVSGAYVKMWYGVAFFGLIAVLFGYRALDRRPRVTIDGSGITDSRNSIGLIPWSEISEATYIPFGRVDFIRVKVKDADIWRDKLPLKYRIRWNSFQKQRVISIPLQNMSVPAAVVQSSLSRRMHLASRAE